MSASKKDGRLKSAKAASIYDVARESGVSVFTVSAVVNKKSHVGKKLLERVESAIQKLNYRPNLIARSLAKQRTHTIGMIVPDIANPFFPMVVRGAEDAAQKHGYNLLLCNSDDNLDKEESAVELLLSKRVDGILLTKAAEDFRPAMRQMIKEMNVPFVLVMRTYPKLTKDAVITDDYQGAYEAVCHLARAGRRRIGLISGPLKISNAKARWQGFHDALKAKDLPYDPELVVEGDYRIESWLGIFRPRLTTVELPKHQLGSEAAELLIQRIAGDRSKAVVRKLQPELRVRESCGFALHVSRTQSHDSSVSEPLVRAGR